MEEESVAEEFELLEEQEVLEANDNTWERSKMTERAGKAREQLLNQGSSYKRTGAEMKGNRKVKKLKFALVKKTGGKQRPVTLSRKQGILGKVTHQRE